MPPLARAVVCLLLAAGYALCAVAPCGPVLEDPGRGPSLAAQGPRAAEAEEEPAARIAAACPCGCAEKAPVRGGGSGFALALPSAEAAFRPTEIALAATPPAAPSEPARDVDPVPI